MDIQNMFRMSRKQLFSLILGWC